MPCPLPRRYAQRRALRHDKYGPSTLVLQNKKEQSRIHEPRIIRKKKVNTWRRSSSITVDESGSVSDSGFDQDSSCNSQSDQGSGTDAEASYYQQMMNEFEAEGVTLSNPSDETKAMMEAELERWEQFCKVSKIDEPSTAIKTCKAAIFKAYLFWRVKNSRIKKESSIITCWKVLSMVYARLAERYMDEGILYDIRNWIPQNLTIKFGLDDSEKEKSGLFVEDLCTLQNGHWVRDTEVYAHERLRVQMSPFLNLAGCTATRPKALVGLLYEDIEFQLFPPLIKGQPPIVVMKLNLKRIKRSGGKKKQKIFAFYEAEDLACCGVTFMLALALADNAFESKFKSLGDIYTLIVPPDTDRIRLQWDNKWAERPVFRDVDSTANGIRISKTKCLQYSKHRHYLIRLGRTCGYEKRLEFYDLRRASGKRLNESVTPEERRQIMGHRGDVYERYYMPAFIDTDCQAIYLGSTRREDLIRAVGRLSRHERAPSNLTDIQKFEISQDPDILQLIQKREESVQNIKARGYSTIKAAAKTRWYEKHQEIQAEINNLRSQKSKQLLDKTIKEFHKTVHTIEVDRQLQGILPADILTPSTIEYELEERATIARMLFEPLTGLTENQIIQKRIELVQNLIQLCKRQESPHQYQAARSKGRSRNHITNSQTVSEDTDSNLVTISLILDATTRPDQLSKVSKLFCAFCRWNDNEVGPKKREHKYLRIDSLSRHIKTQHLQSRTTGEGFHCPYQECSAFLGSAMHFLNHTARQHGLSL
ncbi:uncharacterized protein EAF01_010154 [Botrytis porri]|uniref:uncharacterized protein n=1 Tax=Botrytis porri TaxID=87229 RepID=UPI0019029510|nr:uncharacterized protein EAF01_010154 [Botrytis porri]KAF7894704.1 hypothetical protein EAF01_010154 [Botrytis porri]